MERDHQDHKTVHEFPGNFNERFSTQAKWGDEMLKNIVLSVDVLLYLALIITY